MTAGSTSGYFKRNGLSFGGGGICYEIRFNIKLYDIKILVCVLEVMETPERMQGTSATAAAPFATARPVTPTEGTNIWKRHVSPSAQAELTRWTEAVTSAVVVTKRVLDLSVLNVFTDASGLAWCFEIRDKNFDLLFSRAGLLTKTTIPRGELMALYFAVEDVAAMNLAELGTTKVRFYTDSECNVYRLRRPKQKLPVFERNRVDKMFDYLRSMKVPATVTHIEGCSNPSDFSTRPSYCSVVRPPIDVENLRLICNDPDNLRFDPREPIQPSAADGVYIDSIFRMTTRSTTRSARAADSTEPTLPADHEQTTGEADDVPTAFEASVDVLERVRLQQATMIEIHQRIADGHPEFHFDEDGLIRRKRALVICDEALITEIIDHYHGNAHLGINATYNRIRIDYYIKGLSRLIKRFVRNCIVCQQVRAHRSFTSQLTDSYITNLDAIGVNTVVGMDIATVDSTQDNTCFISCTCCISKYLRAGALPDQTSPSVIQVLDKMFAASIYPRVIVTDGASTFKSRNFKIWTLKHGISHVRLPPYASEYGGWIERGHQYLLEGLRVQGNNDRDWASGLQKAVQMANSRPYDSNDEFGISPLHLAHPSYVFRASPWDFGMEQDEQLMKEAMVSHMLPPRADDMSGLHRKIRAKTQRMIEDYGRVYESKRLKIRERLQKRLAKVGFEVGDSVRVFRPSISKVGITWSEVRKVAAKPSLATRIIRDEAGRESLEHVINLQLVAAGNVPYNRNERGN